VWGKIRTFRTSRNTPVKNGVVVSSGQPRSPLKTPCWPVVKGRVTIVWLCIGSNAFRPVPQASGKYSILSSHSGKWSEKTSDKKLLSFLIAKAWGGLRWPSPLGVCGGLYRPKTAEESIDCTSSTPKDFHATEANWEWRSSFTLAFNGRWGIDGPRIAKLPHQEGSVMGYTLPRVSYGQSIWMVSWVKGRLSPKQVAPDADPSGRGCLGLSRLRWPGRVGGTVRFYAAYGGPHGEKTRLPVVVSESGIAEFLITADVFL